MDTRLLDALRIAPNIDLYQLSLAINQMLSDPQRILDVRRHLHLGAHVMYFDHRRGILAPGRVLQMQAANATVKDELTHVQWKLPYAAIVVDPAQRPAQATQAPPQRVDAGTFKLGDTVGFTDKHLRERIGTVTRINTKSCSLICDGEQWRVSPGLLRKIIDL